MTFQIRNLVLYSHDGQRRELPLNSGVNIITGKSKTGKSAIIEIIEFCLARKDCPVSDGVVLESVSWYLAHLKFPNLEVIVARPGPTPETAVPSEMYFAQGSTLSVPEFGDLKANSNRESVQRELSQLMGIAPNRNLPDAGSSRHALEANLGHALLLVSQQQGEIANKKTLFHRQDEPFMPQTIKDTLPYFLGAVGEKQLALQQRLQRERRELKMAGRRLREAEAVAGDGLSRANELAVEAQEVGLLPPAALPAERVKLIELLDPIRKWTPDGDARPMSPEAEQLAKLQAERRQVRGDYRRVSEDLAQALEIERDVNGFSEGVAEKKSRLTSLKLFPAGERDEVSCPVCASSLDDDAGASAGIARSFANLESSLLTVKTEKPRVREYVERTQLQRDQTQRRLQELDVGIEAAIRENEQAQRLRDVSVRRAHVAGRVSLYLDSLGEVGDLSALRQEVAKLVSTIEGLEAQLSESGKEEQLQFILTEINFNIKAWAQELGLEHSDCPLFLDLMRLTIVADKGSRYTPLTKMGGGENWLGYHLVTHMALHRHFVQKNRPVPRFLVLDQPTQVYFPSDGALSSIDRTTVLKMFKFLFREADRLENFQLVIFDHANLDDVEFQKRVIANWWQDGSLVPTNWPKQAA